jgi:thiol-disulfide isomerase/thioredoxin
LTNSRLFAAIGLAALAAGAGLWHLAKPTRSPATAESPVSTEAPAISPTALYATTFQDPSGREQSLGQFQGRVLVLNFWATWCGPCREEMPAFNRLHASWAGRGVQFLGISDEPGATAARFGAGLGIGYPLWTGGDQVSELSRRLGNRRGVLPHTVIVSPRGEVIEQRVGPYTEAELNKRLVEISPNKR